MLVDLHQEAKPRELPLHQILTVARMRFLPHTPRRHIAFLRVVKSTSQRSPSSPTRVHHSRQRQWARKSRPRGAEPTQQMLLLHRTPPRSSWSSIASGRGATRNCTTWSSSSVTSWLLTGRRALTTTGSHAVGCSVLDHLPGSRNRWKAGRYLCDTISLAKKSGRPTLTAIPRLLGRLSDGVRRYRSQVRSISFPRTTEPTNTKKTMNYRSTRLTTSPITPASRSRQSPQPQNPSTLSCRLQAF